MTSAQWANYVSVHKDELAVPFTTVVLRVEVTVSGVELVPGSGVVALCQHGEHRQRISILDLPLPSSPLAGAQWIEVYRHWARWVRHERVSVL